MIYTDLKTMKKKFYSPVKEEFYGRTKNIDIIYENLSSLVKEINSMSELESGSFAPNYDKRNIAIENAIENEWGFKRCILYWEAAHEWVFGTFPGGLLFEKPPGLKDKIWNRQKNDRWYDEEKNYTCLIGVSSYGIRHMNLNSDEVMGLLLHEVGHSFDNTFGRFFTYAYSTIATLGLYEFMEFGFKHGLIDLNRDFIKNFPLIYKMIDFIMQMFMEVRYVATSLMGPLAIPGIITFTILSGAIFIHHPMVRSEAFCDEFAEKYGFGPGLASAMQKIYGSNYMNAHPSKLLNMLHKIPVIRTIIDLWCMPTMIVTEIFYDMHPNGESRIENIKKDLVRDYNDPEVPKDMKPIIKKQIDECTRIQKYDMCEGRDKQLLIVSIRKALYYNSSSTFKKLGTFWHDIGKEEPKNYDYNIT